MFKKPILIISDNEESAEKIKEKFEAEKRYSRIEIIIASNEKEAVQSMLSSPIVEIHFDPDAVFYKDLSIQTE